MLHDTAASLESDNVEVWHAVVWQLLTRCVSEQMSALRLPVVATAGPQGPDARVVMLRAVDPDARQLTMFTDTRSGKVDALVADGRLTWVFWEPKLALQVRAHSVATINVGNHRALEIARQVPEDARRDYVSVSAPGTMLVTTQTDPELFERNFCVIDAHVHSLDILSLRQSGHKRLHLDYIGQQRRWLVP